MKTNTIELTDVIEAPTKRSYAGLKGLLIALVFVAGSYIPKALDYAQKEYRDAREALLMSMIEEDLKGKTVTIDLKNGVAGAPITLSRQELLKALYILQVRESQHEFDMQLIRGMFKE